MTRKKCSGCKKTLNLSKFSKHRSTKDGKQTQCKLCNKSYVSAYDKANPGKAQARQHKYRESHKEKIAIYKKIHREANIEKILARDNEYYHTNKNVINFRRKEAHETNPLIRLRSRWKASGMDPDEAQAVWELYKECQVCGSKENLCVDHCHDTGKVRGILCRACNAGIGLIGDNLESINKAASYLRDAKSRQSRTG